MWRILGIMIIDRKFAVRAVTLYFMALAVIGIVLWDDGNPYGKQYFVEAQETDTEGAFFALCVERQSVYRVVEK